MAYAITRERVRQYEAIMHRCAESLMRATGAVPGNGQGYAYFAKGDVRATLSTNPYAVWATSAIGLTGADETTIDDVVAFFQLHGVSPRVRIVPDGFTKYQAARLAKHRLRQTGFHTVMHAWLPFEYPSAAPLSAGVEIKHVTDAAEFDVALATQIAGWGIPAVPDSPLVRIRRWWRELPSHRMYLAYVDGAPAAHAMLYVDGNVACMENASTIPGFRNRGLHRALIHRRIDDATALGCKTIVGAADFESSSRSNQMSAGLEIAYMAAHWSEV